MSHSAYATILKICTFPLRKSILVLPPKKTKSNIPYVNELLTYVNELLTYVNELLTYVNELITYAN